MMDCHREKYTSAPKLNTCRSCFVPEILVFLMATGKKIQEKVLMLPVAYYLL